MADQITPSTIPEVVKSQDTRLLDVFLLGPLLIAAGLRKGPLQGWMKWGLIASGVGTIIYNWNRYKKNEEILTGMP